MQNDDLVERVADKLAEIYLLGGTDDEVARAIIPIVQAAERERCARLAEGFAGLPNALLAAAIRAGGQP